ncbi:MAG: PQQ-binding-like beta-propeller repeat protein [Planctomycetia bacterium]|nr:PQQ-binding-like beta-propeller repeat protein [Planctomycetia bacterium]
MNALLPCLLASLLTVPAAEPTLTGPEWPGYKGDAGTSGCSPDATIKPPFKLAWTYRLDGDASSDAGGGVVVAGGKLFVSVHNTKALLALDARTGRFLWERTGIPGGIRTVPTYADGRLHLLIREGGVSQPKSASILVLDAATGKDLWRQPLSAEGIDPHKAGLPVLDGKVYGSEGGAEPAVTAFDAATGKAVWRVGLGKEDGIAALTPVAAGGRVFVATRTSHTWKQSTEGATIALDAATGKELWRRKGVFPWTSLTTDGQAVGCAGFQSEDSRFHLLDARTGASLWQAPKRFHYSPATLTRDLVLIKPYGSDVIGVERATGKQLWHFQGKANSGCCSPSVAGGYAYVGTGVPSTGDLENLPTFQYGKAPPRELGHTGTLHAIDLKTGKSVWHFSTGNTICGEPALAYGRLYFHSRDGCVYCFVPAREGEPTTPEARDVSPPAPPATVAALLAPDLQDKPRPGRDWPMLGGGPSRAGLEGTTLPASLELGWKFAAGERLGGAPAVRDGVVYCAADSGKLHAVDLQTGKPVWEFAAGAPLRCSPAVAGGLVYGGSDSGECFALETATGKRRWTFAAGGPVRGSPVVVGGLVLFGANDHRLYALDRTTGKKLWSYRCGDYCVQVPPVVYGDRVYCGQWTEWVYALDLKTGQELWRSFVPLSVEALAVHRDRLWVRNVHYLVELDPATGKRLRLGDASWGWGSMAFLQNKIYVSGIQSQYGTHGAAVTDLEQEGKPLEKIPTLEGVLRLKSCGLSGAAQLAAMGTPLALGDKLAFASVSGKVFLTDPDGKVLWSAQLDGTCHASPVAADGHLLIGGDDGCLYAFR